MLKMKLKMSFQEEKKRNTKCDKIIFSLILPFLFFQFEDLSIDFNINKLLNEQFLRIPKEVYYTFVRVFFNKIKITL